MERWVYDPFSWHKDFDDDDYFDDDDDYDDITGIRKIVQLTEKVATKIKITNPKWKNPDHFIYKLLSSVERKNIIRCLTIQKYKVSNELQKEGFILGAKRINFSIAD